MDASAYLVRHGWSGGGLGYRQEGIKKPVLASQKRGFLGVGTRAAGDTSDQWWLGAFNNGLKSVNVEELQTAAKPVTNSSPMPQRRHNLYDKFVRGKGLEGTIDHGEQRAKKITKLGSNSRKSHGPGRNDLTMNSQPVELGRRSGTGLGSERTSAHTTVKKPKTKVPHSRTRGSGSSGKRRRDH